MLGLSGAIQLVPIDWARIGKRRRHRQAPGRRFSALSWQLRTGLRFETRRTAAGLICREVTAADLSASGFSSARRSLREQRRNSHQVVGEHSRSNPQLEAISSLGETALHAATSEQHRDAPLDAGAKALALLEVRALLVCFALRSFLAAALRNAHHLDAVVLARRQVLFTKEVAIRAVQFRDPPKGLPVALKRGRDMDLVGRVSLQHFVLRDQTLRAFGEEHLVAELDGRSLLATLDQVGMGLKNGIDLLAIGNLLA